MQKKPRRISSPTAALSWKSPPESASPNREEEEVERTGVSGLDNAPEYFVAEEAVVPPLVLLLPLVGFPSPAAPPLIFVLPPAVLSFLPLLVLFFGLAELSLLSAASFLMLLSRAGDVTV